MTIRELTPRGAPVVNRFREEKAALSMPRTKDQEAQTDLWSEHLRRTLAGYDEPLLRRVSAHLFKPRSQWPVEELLERSLATMANAVVIDRRLKELEPAQRRVLALIGHSRQPCWDLGNLVFLIMALGDADGLPPILALLEAGLLYPYLAEGPKRLKSFEQWLGQAGTTGLHVFAHPAVMGRALGEDLGLPDLSVAPAAERNSTTHHAPRTTQEADGLDWLLRLAALWQLLAGGALRRTQQGSFFKRDLERLTQDARLGAPPADALAPLPDPALFVAALAELEKIAGASDGEVRAGDLPAVWEEGLLPALASLYANLFRMETWDAQNGAPEAIVNGRGNPFPSAYLLTLLLLGRLPAGAWTAPIDLERWLSANHPYWKGESVRPSQRRSWLAAFLLGLAQPLDVVQTTKAPDGDYWVRLSPMGRWLLGLGQPPSPPASYPQTVLVQPNLEIVAYRQGLTPALIARLSRFANWKSFGAACLLQIQADSVYRALQTGWTYEDILQVLQRHGMRPVPPAVVESLRTWANKRERITTYPSATLFEFATADDLNAALARGLPGTQISDRLAIVPGENAVDFRHFRLAGTRDYGLPPEKCVEVGSDGVTLTIDLARSDLLVETELLRFAAPVEEKTDGRRQFRMTPESMIAGRAAGLSLRALEEWFPQRTGQPLSPAGRLLMTGGQMPPALLRTHLVVHVATPELADGLLQWPGTRALIAERLGPTALAVAAEHVDGLRQRLTGLGATLES
jgi:Helicase conserved C-terminal domain